MHKNTFFKQIITSIIILVILFGFYTPIIYSYDNNYFVVTAYYSPLPNQNFYLTGNYKDEKRLNGQGIRGASGKGVFSGMLAAPKNYSFGTKINLHGLGIGVVEDRGGAIVNAGNRGYSSDRIDVWMGYGDEGLRRALYWGKRKIQGNIISRGSKITLDYKKIAAPMWATKNLKKIPNIFNESIGKGSNIQMIKNLQTFLLQIGVYSGELSGIYNNEIISLVYDFQLLNNIVSSEYSSGAGYWGNLTRKTFLKKYLNGYFEKENKISNKNIVENKEQIINGKDIIFDFPVKSISSIKSLQSILLEMGLYKGKINGNYENIRNIIWQFQIDNKIIKTKYEKGASYYGPKTRAGLKIAYKKYLELNKRKLELEKQFKDLEDIANKEAKIKVNAIGNPAFGEVSARVRSLQKLFGLLGYFEAKDTAIFGPKTKESIVKFQIEKNIISSKEDKGAGIFGPKTSEFIAKELGKQLLGKKIIEENLDQKLLIDIGILKT